jgi:E3 ubiquitin-protein ligase MGRN1
MNDIFGVENQGVSGGDMDMGEGNLCLVCMENPKDTVVLPCRHLCLCRKDAQIIRM